MTRAKAAAIEKPSDAAIKKPLAAKKSVTAAANGQPRKRAALGDISNADKGNAMERVADGKKATGGISSKTLHAPTIAKAAAKPASTTRPALGLKDSNAVGKELKRSASKTDVSGPATKKRTKSSDTRSSHDDESVADENTAPAVNESVKVKVTETVKIKTQHMEQEVKRETRWVDAEEEALAQTIRDMDDEDTGDPLMVSEYVYEILEYMRELEDKTQPAPDYMADQPGLDWRMRGVLVDWLLEVHTRFHLLPETFYLTVNLIDRFLSRKHVQMDRLQLVGVTAMFIASKYEEVLSPHINNFVHVADNGFTEQEILHAERYMLQTLDFDISFPNPMHFMRRISKADQYDIHTRTLAKYLLEISLLDHRFLHYKPSINAAASMYLSRMILDKGEWDDVLVHYSGYTEEDIQPAVTAMISYLRAPVCHNAFYKKYAGKKFLKGKIASVAARNWQKLLTLVLQHHCTLANGPNATDRRRSQATPHSQARRLLDFVHKRCCKEKKGQIFMTCKGDWRLLLFLGTAA